MQQQGAKALLWFTLGSCKQQLQRHVVSETSFGPHPWREVEAAREDIGNVQGRKGNSVKGTNPDRQKRQNCRGTLHTGVWPRTSRAPSYD